MREQHTLSDDQVRGRYCDGTYRQTGHTTEGDDFDAWLARVRRDAAREALREARNALCRKYQFTPPLLDDGRNPSPDERVGARHAVNVAMAFIVEQMDKIEETP